MLDPGYMVGGIEGTLQQACLGQLTNYVKGTTWDWIASDFTESVSWADDPTRLNFTLRPGIQWSNGYGELTSDDVKFAFERMKGTDWADVFAALSHVETHDRYSGTVVLSYPFAPIILVTLCHGSGSVLSKKAVEEAGGKYTVEFPAICGPYQLSWVPKQRIQLSPNPLWTGAPVGIERVDFVVIEDEKTAELAYEAGEIDQTTISIDSLSRYRNDPPPNTTLLELPGLHYMWVGMNTENPKLQDIRVRQAIQRAINVDEILAGAFGGLVPKAFGTTPPGLLGYRTASKYSYDPREAKRLLEDAGAAGLRLTLKSINATDRLSAAQIIQANLAEIGIELEIMPLDSGVFWSLGQESEGNAWKDLEIWIMEYGSSPDPYESFLWFLSSQKGIWNWERWTNTEFDELHEKGLRETDPSKRAGIYLRMQEIMEDTGAYVWLGHPPSPLVYRDSVDPHLNPMGGLLLPKYRWVA